MTRLSPCNDRPARELCFAAGSLESRAVVYHFSSFLTRPGDDRVNENAGLTAFQTVYMRFHNYVAENLARRHRSWKDEKLFQVKLENRNKNFMHSYQKITCTWTSAWLFRNNWLHDELIHVTSSYSCTCTLYAYNMYSFSDLYWFYVHVELPGIIYQNVLFFTGMHVFYRKLVE